MNGTFIIFSACVLVAASAWFAVHSRNMQIWLGSYVRQWPRRRQARREVRKHIYFAFCDHFEPYWGGADRTMARARAQRWFDAYPEVAGKHHDSGGRHPVHTFFYPEEEYDPEILSGLSMLRQAGFGDVEVHLHHDRDHAEALEQKLRNFANVLNQKHGLLRRDPESDEVLFAFIHGNWALDNSRPDGKWCGVNDELTVLVRAGCRVDMTMPSAPSETQTRKINSIYFAKGRPGQSKAHNSGRDAAVGEWGASDELLLVQGPLALNWGQRKLGFFPRIEASEISADAPPSPHRVRLWEEAAVCVRGAEDHVFIKLHTHGAEDRTSDALLGGSLSRLWSDLESRFRDRPGYVLHYVSAWEMYDQIRSLCGSRSGKC